MTEQTQTKKPFKLPPEVRLYHKNKEREKHGGWKCTCGKPNPIYMDLETKKKLCKACAIIDLTQRIQEAKQ